ncbi:MAG TPA: hypothetical protein VJT14_02195 [Candidatus Dormibacteraeota bacterium]|nr:hypothetical protein [Candidatus Dormibacteraeota bacterium]
MKTPKTIGLLAVPVVLAAAIVSATGAFAKAPAHQSAAASLRTVKLGSAGSADAVKPAAQVGVPAVAPSQPKSEPTESATEPASTETTDAAGGHADDPNDPNADHQFNGEE